VYRWRRARSITRFTCPAGGLRPRCFERGHRQVEASCQSAQWRWKKATNSSSKQRVFDTAVCFRVSPSVESTCCEISTHRFWPCSAQRNAYCEGRTEGGQGGTMPRATSSFFNTVHSLPKDLRFEHGGARLVSCPEPHLTLVRPWLFFLCLLRVGEGAVRSSWLRKISYLVALVRLSTSIISWFCEIVTGC